MTHPVHLDELLSRYKYAPHDGSPVMVAERRGKRVLVGSEFLHDLWPDILGDSPVRLVHHGKHTVGPLLSRDGWRTSEIDGRWSDHIADRERWLNGGDP